MMSSESQQLSVQAKSRGTVDGEKTPILEGDPVLPLEDIFHPSISPDRVPVTIVNATVSPG